MKAAGLAAKIKDKFGIDATMEKAQKTGQLDVYVGDEKLEAPTGILSKLLGRTERAYLAEIGKRATAPV